MDPEKRLRLQRHLAEAERHIAEGERVLQQQRKLVAQRRRDGLDATLAEQILSEMEYTQELHIAGRESLYRALSADF